MIYRYPRYGELYDAWQSQKNAGSRAMFGPQDFRDLQMWSQLAWFDENFRRTTRSARVAAPRARLHARRPGAHGSQAARDRGPGDARVPQAGGVGPNRNLDHAILSPDSSAGMRFRDCRRFPIRVPLPPRFRYPGDARKQLEMAREFTAQTFGAAPAGLWPSEGSVSDEAFGIAAELGYRWRPPIAECSTEPWGAAWASTDFTGLTTGSRTGVR